MYPNYHQTDCKTPLLFGVHGVGLRYEIYIKQCNGENAREYLEFHERNQPPPLPQKNKPQDMLKIVLNFEQLGNLLILTILLIYP